MLHSVVLYHIVLYRACYVTLKHNMIPCILWFCITLYDSTLCYIVPYHAFLHYATMLIISYSILFYFNILYHILFYSILFFSFVIYYFVLYYITLCSILFYYYIILYYSILYYTIFHYITCCIKRLVIDSTMSVIVNITIISCCYYNNCDEYIHTYISR